MMFGKGNSVGNNMIAQFRYTVGLAVAMLLVMTPRSHLMAEESTVINQTDFRDNFDMNGDYAAHVYRVEGMKIWNEQSNGYAVRYWGPARTGVSGELVYRYQFARPILEASIACNLLHHAANDSVLLEVSGDDETYYRVTQNRVHPDVEPPYQLTRFDLSSYVAGGKEVFLRIQLTGKQLNTSIMSSQFLRTAKDMPFFNAPHVYDFQATLKPKP